MHDLTVLSSFFFLLGPVSATNFQMTQDKDQPDFIQVSWSEPDYITGQLESYTLFYKQADSNTDKWTTLALPGSFSSFRLSDFKAGAKYTGYVVPIDGTGPGIASNKATIRTLSGKTFCRSRLLFSTSLPLLTNFNKKRKCYCLIVIYYQFFFLFFRIATSSHSWISFCSTTSRFLNNKMAPRTINQHGSTWLPSHYKQWWTNWFGSTTGRKQQKTNTIQLYRY